jgi:hypothetical protein
MSRWTTIVVLGACQALRHLQKTPNSSYTGTGVPEGPIGKVILGLLFGIVFAVFLIVIGAFVAIGYESAKHPPSNFTQPTYPDRRLDFEKRRENEDRLLEETLRQREELLRPAAEEQLRRWNQRPKP